MTNGAIALRNELYERSNSRKKETIEGLWRVLEAMRHKGVKAFTIAQVGRHAEAAGVLRTQTLRNAGGEDYRLMIDAFAREIGVATTTVASTKVTPLEEAIDAIADLDVRTRLKMVLGENSRYREEINRLRQAFKHLETGRTPEEPSGEILPALSVEVDIVPLQKFTSSAWIDERRWTVEPSGAVYDDAGECLAPVGFMSSLTAALRALSRRK